MTDTQITANLYALEQRIHQLEQKIEHMADVGDMVRVEWPLHGNLYEWRNVVIQAITKAHGDEVEE